jgi:hypothetical protein
VFVDVVRVFFPARVARNSRQVPNLVPKVVGRYPIFVRQNNMVSPNTIRYILKMYKILCLMYDTSKVSMSTICRMIARTNTTVWMDDFVTKMLVPILSSMVEVPSQGNINPCMLWRTSYTTRGSRVRKLGNKVS